MEKYDRYQNIVIYFIRVIIGVIFFHHGALKVFDFESVVEKYETMGFPGLLWVIIGIVEMATVVYLFSDKYVRHAGAVLCGVIGMAILTVQLPAALMGIEGAVGALERDLLVLGANALIVVTGGGRVRLKPLHSSLTDS